MNIDSRYITTLYNIASFPTVSKKGEVHTMDPLLRGLCEQHIDKKLSMGDIQDIMDLVETLDILVTSKEDAALGLFLGTIYNQLSSHCLKLYDRPPERNEIQDYNLILKRRSSEIKAMIAQYNTSKTTRPFKDDMSELDENIDDYVLTIQKKTKELTNERESEAENQKPDDTDNAPDSREKPKVKFSFDSRSQKKPKRNILGIPIKKKKTIMKAAT